eukprot:11877676-Heterocapsa_arctica.AAC.1
MLYYTILYYTTIAPHAPSPPIRVKLASYLPIDLVVALSLPRPRPRPRPRPTSRPRPRPRPT